MTEFSFFFLSLQKFLVQKYWYPYTFALLDNRPFADDGVIFFFKETPFRLFFYIYDYGNPSESQRGLNNKIPNLHKKTWRVLVVVILGDAGAISRREKRRDESFQVRSEEPLGNDSHDHRTISKNSSVYRLLIGHKEFFVLFCPIGELFLLSSFREFVHDGYCQATLARFVHQAFAYKGNFYFLLS